MTYYIAFQNIGNLGIKYKFNIYVYSTVGKNSAHQFINFCGKNQFF